MKSNTYWDVIPFSLAEVVSEQCTYLFSRVKSKQSEQQVGCLLLAYSFTLKIKAVHSSQTLVNFYQATTSAPRKKDMERHKAAIC
jgi:hypothetical protein